MDAKPDDLHGNVPDSSPVALLIIDMINDLEFPGGDQLQEPARLLAYAITDLKQRAKTLNLPVIYVNDNFGRWRSDSAEVLEHVLQTEFERSFWLKCSSQPTMTRWYSSPKTQPFTKPPWTFN